MPSHTLSEWAAHLRAVAGPVAVKPPPTAGTVGPPFAAVTCGRDPGPTPHPVPPADAGLWWALVDGGVDVDGLLEDGGAGSLWPLSRFSGIEVWTETELCGLHALWCLARRRRRDDWAQRADAVRDWHLVNTQPDNATNRPWALHVFLLADRHAAEARAYAETLLHNAMVAGGGSPDLLSAWILMDAAGRIEEEERLANSD